VNNGRAEIETGHQGGDYPGDDEEGKPVISPAEMLGFSEQANNSKVRKYS